MARKTQKRKKSSAWVHRQRKDTYVRQANQAGYRSRAAFKLDEINRKFKLIKPGMRVLDLGAAPGGWSQVASSLIGDRGRVVAVDLLPVQPIDRVRIIMGDFGEQQVQAQVLAQFDQQPADVVISDMSPDLTGIRITDQANMEDLLQTVIHSLFFLLKPGGDLLIKVFEGQLLAELRRSLKSLFLKMNNVKPEASRKQSREFYLIAQHYQPDELQL